MNKDLKEARDQVLRIPIGRTYQAERIASVRAEVGSYLVCGKKSKEMRVADEMKQGGE